MLYIARVPIVSTLILAVLAGSPAHAITGFFDESLPCIQHLSEPVRTSLTPPPSIKKEDLLEQITRRHYDAKELKGSIYYDFSKFPPLVLDSVRAVPTHEFTPEDWNESMLCGTCGDMLHRYFRSFILPVSRYFGELTSEDYTRLLKDHGNISGKFILVYVNGELLGLVKAAGEPSFLALRNVINSNGEIRLALGGVYALPESLLNTAFKAALKQPELENKNFERASKHWRGSVGIVHLDQLTLHPESFLYSSRAQNNSLNTEILEQFSSHSDSKSWPSLLAHLNWLRERLESENATDPDFNRLRSKLSRTVRIREHRGDFQESLQTVVEIERNYTALIQHLQTNLKRSVSPSEVEVEPYLSRDSAGWDSHIILINGRPWGFADGTIPETQHD